ncbi:MULTISPECIES: carbohydrate ABC transporter permease [unclassified Brenneria]|uniref:carbohydrate ABC transporter permease n=1 Tax=unclassified Brenneria TaxID=2634434 RepID=UPI0018F06C8C|nr:carbohydrate ABC transporter permease [Brenneria sp. L3-3C-1]MBJ7222734.1 carbohydrate ABC transporter permease [Brenneria sp. L3-3C-1]MEE3643978.1 carbohydrate ABC transporter permease [Brenneria sp. L3_3C_1]
MTSIMFSIKPLRLLRYTAATLLALLFALPLMLAVSAALKTPAELMDVLALPASWYSGNFSTGWQQISGSLFNSIKITLPAILLSVLIGCIAAFPLSMLPIKSSRWIYLFLLSGMFVPYQIVQIPVFFMMRQLGLYNQIAGLWLVHTAYGVPICTFFMRNFFATVPRSIFEAAQLDGCGPTGYFFKILLPASLSGIAALTIVQSRSIWNDLLFAMTLTNNDSTMPVTAKLNGFVSAIQVDYGALMASALISVLPILLVFLCFQKAFVRGLLGGNSK